MAIFNSYVSHSQMVNHRFSWSTISWCGAGPPKSTRTGPQSAPRRRGTSQDSGQSWKLPVGLVIDHQKPGIFIGFSWDFHGFFTPTWGKDGDVPLCNMLVGSIAASKRPRADGDRGFGAGQCQGRWPWPFRGGKVMISGGFEWGIV